MMGDVIQLDADAKGYVAGDCVRARIWLNVHEPVMRWVQLESAKKGTIEFFDIQYENLPHLCFSCGLLGHAKALCLTPAGRDEFVRPP